MIEGINTRLRELRKALGLKLTDLGDAMGITASGLSAIERGTREVSERHIKLIKAAYSNVSEDWLRTGEGEMFEEPQDDIDRVCEAYGFGDIARAAMHEFVRLTPEHQQLITDYARPSSATCAMQPRPRPARPMTPTLLPTSSQSLTAPTRCSALSRTSRPPATRKNRPCRSIGRAYCIALFAFARYNKVTTAWVVIVWACPA